MHWLVPPYADQKFISTKQNLEDELNQVISLLRKTEEERELDQVEWQRQRRDEETRWQSSLDEKEKVSFRLCFRLPLVDLLLPLDRTYLSLRKILLKPGIDF